MLKKIAGALVGLLLFAALVMVGWYQVDGQPLPEASSHLRGEGYSAREEEDGALVFTPAAPNGHGLLIMHGALIKPLAYAKTAAWFASRGYTVYVPNGALRLSINAVDAAAGRMSSFDVRDWVMIGHSMGGFASLELITRHAPKVRALALWACAMPADFTGLKLPILYLHGDRDGLLTERRFEEARQKLPPTVRYELVPGANHRGFALYSHQFFDDDASIAPAEQIDIADQRTAEFFAAHL